MATLDPISIATIGYVCGGVINPIARGTHGYVCLSAVPPEPDRRDGDGGHGAFILDPQPYTPDNQTEEQKLAILAIMAIQEYYDP